MCWWHRWHTICSQVPLRTMTQFPSPSWCPSHQTGISTCGIWGAKWTWCRPPTQKYQEALDGSCRLKKNNQLITLSHTINSKVSVIHLMAYNFPLERQWVAKQHFFQHVTQVNMCQFSPTFPVYYESSITITWYFTM